MIFFSLPFFEELSKTEILLAADVSREVGKNSI